MKVEAIMSVTTVVVPSRRPRVARATRSLLPLLLLVLPVGVVPGQSYVSRESASPAASHGGARRFVAGERARYELRLAGREVGTGSLEVLGEEQLNGYTTLHTTLQISGGVLFARVNDRFDSWIDPASYFSRRFVQDQHELTSRRYREYNLAPESKSFVQVDNGEKGTLETSEPLDDVSFLFYARTLPLNVGDVDTIPRYFKPGHDVILRVLRKERVTVPAGTFETIVVQPTISNAGGLFGQGGQAELYFSDDASRTLVMLRSRVPVIGALTLTLKDYRAGQL
jgi:hypothetical protein